MQNKVQNKAVPSIVRDIQALKQKHNAIILAHYYQIDEIQQIADFIGDSLELSKKAKATNCDVIVFCGVKFMAETAKILSPSKTVILPDMMAGCSLEQSCRPAEFAAFRQKYPKAVAITYINCSAEIKALSDIICTSSNAERVINSVPAGTPIIFAPDKNLGAYLSQKTGREMILWDGACIVHETFSHKEVVKLKIRHPQALTIAHPECTHVLLDEADFIGSTSKLLEFVSLPQNLSVKDFIILTEPGIVYKMSLARPDANFILAPALQKNSAECINCNNCHFMKMNNLENLHACLQNLSPQIHLTEDLIAKARKSLDAMLILS